MAVINIRGPNGSGKSTLARALIESDLTRTECTIEGVPAYHLPETDTIVLGPYRPGQPTGGMDNVNKTDVAIAAVKSAAAQSRNVVFEGVVISTVWTTWLEVARDLKGRGQTFVWAFLDTAPEVCLARVKARRAAKGKDPNDFKEDLVTGKYKSIRGVRAKAKAVGDQKVVDITGLEGHGATALAQVRAQLDV